MKNEPTLYLYNPETDDYDRPVELTAADVEWIRAGSVIPEGWDPFGLQKERELKNAAAIARADALIAECRDLLNLPADIEPVSTSGLVAESQFYLERPDPDPEIEDDPFAPGDSAPEIEPVYDPYREKTEMEEDLRRGG